MGTVCIRACSSPPLLRPLLYCFSFWLTLFLSDFIIIILVLFIRARCRRTSTVAT